MSGRYTVSYTDFDGDTKQASFPVAEPAGDGSDMATWLTNLNSVRDALTAVTSGVLKTDIRTARYDMFDNGTASSPASQAHQRAIIEYQDATTSKVYKDLIIPTPDVTASIWKASGGLTIMDVTQTAVQTLVTALETHVLSVDGNAIEVLKIYLEE